VFLDVSLVFILVLDSILLATNLLALCANSSSPLFFGNVTSRLEVGSCSFKATRQAFCHGHWSSDICDQPQLGSTAASFVGGAVVISVGLAFIFVVFVWLRRRHLASQSVNLAMVRLHFPPGERHFQTVWMHIKTFMVEYKKNNGPVTLSCNQRQQLRRICKEFPYQGCSLPLFLLLSGQGLLKYMLRNASLSAL